MKKRSKKLLLIACATDSLHVQRMDDVQTVILQLTAARGPDKSICPSEVARALHADWQPRMKHVRAAAVALAGQGKIEILRKGKPVADIENLRGVIRLRIVSEIDSSKT